MSDNSKRKGNPFWELQDRYRKENNIPAVWWEPLSVFIKVSDRNLLVHTRNNFPGGVSKDSLSDDNHHPVFLLKRIANYNYLFCPCTSVKKNKFSYIPKGKILKQVTRPTSKDSYICHIFPFNLPAENNMVKQEHFIGAARESDIVGDQYKEAMQ